MTITAEQYLILNVYKQLTRGESITCKWHGAAPCYRKDKATHIARWNHSDYNWYPICFKHSKLILTDEYLEQYGSFGKNSITVKSIYNIGNIQLWSLYD